MIASVKLLWKFYIADWKQRKLWQKICMPLVSFLLILFLFLFLAYYLVLYYGNTAAFQYADYDVNLLNASTAQMKEIADYDYVERFVGYSNIDGLMLCFQENTEQVSAKALHSNNLNDLDGTPWNRNLVIQRDTECMEDPGKNPIALSEKCAKSLGVTLGDNIQGKLGDREITYTVAGIYDDAVRAASNNAGILVVGALQDWINDLCIQSGIELGPEGAGCNHAYVTFSDKEKGRELVKNYIADIDLYSRYGENWRELATQDELHYYSGIYDTRLEVLKSRGDNAVDQHSSIMWLIVLGSAALVLFILWERNKTITLTRQPLTVLLGEGCRKTGIFLYFFMATLIKYLLYFSAALPIICFPFMHLISTDGRTYHFSGALLLQCLPFLLGILLGTALLTAVFLLIQFTRKTVLFTGDE